jgi:hypothetical protein
MKLAQLALGQSCVVKAVPDQAVMRSLQKLEPVASAELLFPKGKVDLAGGHVNTKDGLLFSDDNTLLSKIKHALANGLERVLLRIGTRYWPIKGLQELKSSSWSFVLDYDERTEIPRRVAVQMTATTILSQLRLGQMRIVRN